MDNPRICSKCLTSNWSSWTSASTGKIKEYCKTCRRNRADAYSERKKAAHGSHTKKAWLEKLATYETCPLCFRKWSEIKLRPDKRYKYVWTKDHITPLNQSGSDSIDNIQPLCYQCNFGKR
jgi:hypothetical protein